MNKRTTVFCCAVMTGLFLTLFASAVGLFYGLKTSLRGARDAKNGTAFYDQEADLPSCPVDYSFATKNKCRAPDINGLWKNATIGNSSMNLTLNFPSEREIGTKKNVNGIRPVRYDLNFSFRGKRNFNGNLKILFRTVDFSSRILINFDSKVLDMNMKNIRLKKRCSVEELCIKRVALFPDQTLLSVEPELTLDKFEYYILEFPYFSGSVWNQENGKGSRGLQLSENMAPSWASSTIFQMRYARTVFPCFDHPALKAKFALCIEHGSKSSALSNTKVGSIKKLPRGQIRTCFRKTPVMSTYVFTFSLSSRMQKLKDMSLTNRTELNVYGPYREMSRLAWITEEAQFVLEKLENLTSTNYVLPQLAFINLDPCPFWGIENFGLVSLHFPWTGYPMYDNAHRILVHEIIHQWVGNYFTINYWDEICLQEGFTAYLEWHISNSLSSVKEKLDYKVERTLFDTLRDDPGQYPIIRQFKVTQDIADRCFGKPPLAYHMLVKMFGESVLSRFLTRMSKHYPYGNAGMDEWVESWSIAAGNPMAGRFLHNFYIIPGYPIIFVRKSGGRNQLDLEQKVLRGGAIVSMDGNEEQSTFVVPLNLHSALGSEENTFIFSNKSAPVEFHQSDLSSWYFFEPTDFYGRAFYEVSNYANLLACYEKKTRKLNCTISSAQIRRIFQDFCFGLLEDQFPIEIGNNSKFIAHQWTEVFAKLFDLSSNIKRGQSQIHLGGSCTCCLATEPQLLELGWRCARTWGGTCRNLKIIGLLGRKSYVE